MRVCILSAVRTPLGALGGGLRTVGAVDLGARVIREALIRSLPPSGAISEVIMGCAFQGGLGPNPARLAARAAGLESPAWTLNHLCASGLMAVIQATRGLASDSPEGRAVAGAFDSPSGTPYLLPAARWGRRMGETQLLDPLLQDGPPWFSHLEVPRPILLEGGAPGPAHLLAVEVPRRRGSSRVCRDEVEDTGSQAPAADGAAALVLGPEIPGRPALARLLGHSFLEDESEARRHLALQAGMNESGIHTVPARGPLLAVGGMPLLVETLHAPPHRFPMLSLPTGDGQRVSLLLECP